VKRRLVLAVVVIAVAAGVTLGGTGLMRVSEMKRELAALEHDNAELRARTQALARTIERLRGDPLYIEKLAREDLGYVRQGDTVLKFPSQAR
jgi:cell division protein FtsB